MQPQVKIELDKTLTFDSMLHQVLNQALVKVKAKGGSLMLVDNRRGIMQIKARLGPPRDGRKTEVVYKVDGKTIAAEAVRTRRPFLCNNVTSEGKFTPSSSGQNFLSLLSVPVLHRDRVLAVINADAPEKDFFCDEAVQLLEGVAAQVAEPIANRVEALEALAKVGIGIARSRGDGGVDDVLQRIADLAVALLGADVVTLYQYNQEKDDFPVEGKGPTIAGNIKDPRPMRRKVFPGDVPWTVVKKRKSGFYPEVGRHDFLTGDVNRPGDEPRGRFITREGIQSMAALLLPYGAEDDPSEEVVGVIFANYRAPHDFNIDEIQLLATFADNAAAAIVSARREESRRSEQSRVAETISANLAHRMSHLAGAGSVAAQTLRKHVAPENEKALIQLRAIELETDRLYKVSARLAGRFKEGRLASLDVVDLRALLEEVVELVAKQHPRVVVTRDFESDLPMVRSIVFQLQQVLHDLLENSIEAMEGVAEPRLQVTARYVPIKGCVEVELTDNGSGVDASLKEKLFIPTETTKKNHLGIGLWVCKTFMQATGGDVELKETAPGKGSTFSLYIPCSDVDGAARSRGAVETKDVLIVEDEAEFRKVIAAGLPEEYSVVAVGSKAEAIKALSTFRFRVAVLDICLVVGTEDTGGLAVLEEIEKLKLETQAVIVTSHRYQDRFRDRLEAAARLKRVKGILDKPPKLEEFHNLVLGAVEASRRKENQQ